MQEQRQGRCREDEGCMIKKKRERRVVKKANERTEEESMKSEK